MALVQYHQSHTYQRRHAVSSSLDHPDGPIRPRRRLWPSRAKRAAAAAALTACAVALPPSLAIAASSSPIGLTPIPTSTVTLPVEIEAYSPWLPQVSCDPVIKPGVKLFTELMLSTYGRGTNGGVTRSCKSGSESEHKEGRAWDWMLDPTNYADVVAGQRAITWMLADDALIARRLGVMYIIWNHRIWSTYRRDEGWRPYSGADPHTSHIHTSFGWAGAMGRTSWWTGKASPVEYGPCITKAGEMAKPYGDTINTKKCPEPKKSSKSVSSRSTSATGGEWFVPPPAP